MFSEALHLLGAVAEQVFVIRQMASASLQLAYVAAGRLDAHCEVGREIDDWVAGVLLIQEAGGEVTDLGGEPFGWNAPGIIAGQPSLRARLLELSRPLFPPSYRSPPSA